MENVTLRSEIGRLTEERVNLAVQITSLRDCELPDEAADAERELAALDRRLRALKTRLLTHGEPS